MEPAIENIVNTVYEQRFSITDNFINEEEIELLRQKINSLKENSQFKKAGIGKDKELITNSEIRSDYIHWLEKNDEEVNKIFFSFIDELMLAINRRFFLGLKDYEFHFAFYPPGTFYKKHRDSFKSDDARKITVLLYLNSNWKPEDGGELMLYRDELPPLKIEPLGGRLLVFESEMEHEVLMSKADRYSITGWLKNKSRLF